jgi:hypothetical protein
MIGVLKEKEMNGGYWGIGGVNVVMRVKFRAFSRGAQIEIGVGTSPMQDSISDA